MVWSEIIIRRVVVVVAVWRRRTVALLISLIFRSSRRRRWSWLRGMLGVLHGVLFKFLNWGGLNLV